MGVVTAALATDLRRETGAWASSAARTRTEASSDFGGIIQRRPAVVARPTNTEQVASLLRFASRHSIPLSVRASGHSAGGQTLNEGGIVLDMRHLSQVLAVNADDRWLEVQPGARWYTVVDAALKSRVVPPVLTGTLSTTVGGTHSVAGLGFASCRHGTQIDNCLGIEVITLDGERLWCDAHEQSELFQHVLGGVGQLAVMTRVRIGLRRYRAKTRRWRLFYPNRARMLADLDILVAAGTADFLAGFGFAVGDRFGYYISVTFEVDTREADERERILAALSPAVVRGPVVSSFEPFTLREVPVKGRHKWRPRPGWANPWIDAILPQERIGPYFQDILPRIPPSVRRNATLAFLPINGRLLTRPLFVVPEGEKLMLAGVWFPTIPSSEAGGAIRGMALAAERIAALGGKRCIYGMFNLDTAGWSRHYGTRWPVLRRLKAQYDPQGILNPGFITYDQAPVAANAPQLGAV